MDQYNRINFDKIKFGKQLSMEEALKDITPLDVPEAVLTGEKQIVVDCVEGYGKDGCVVHMSVVDGNEK